MGKAETVEPRVTRGRWAKYRHRRTLHVAAPPSIGALIRELPTGVERVYLCGRIPFRGVEQVRAWAAAELPAGVTADPRGHYVDGLHPVLRYVVDGRRLEVLTATQWWGEGEHAADVSAMAWRILERLLDSRRFRGATLLSTPATTGRDLFLRTLGSREFPVLAPALQDVIRAGAGQGRIEVLDGPATLPALVEYDGRMMYAGCCRELGSGVPTLDHVNEYAGQQRGRYDVEFTVPAGWSHVGLLGVKHDGGGWSWPADGGYRGRTWCDGAELGVALSHGWQVTIRTRMLFPESGRPLDRWADGLVAALDAAPTDPVLRPMLRAAVRAMILHGIGAFHGRGHTVSRAGTDASAVPAGAGPVTYDRDTGLYQWTETVGVAWPELSHPEWTSAIWARARARLLVAPGGVGALSVPRDQLVGFRTDAIYMSADPGWADDGRVGRFTHRRTIRGPLPRPTSNVQLLELRDGPNDLLTNLSGGPTP